MFLDDLCLMRDGRVFAGDGDQSQSFRATAQDLMLSLWQEPGHTIRLRRRPRRARPTVGRQITRVETLESATVDLNEPTTSAVAPDGFVYIANSQIWKWDDKTEALREGVKLAPIMLREVPL